MKEIIQEPINQEFRGTIAQLSTESRAYAAILGALIEFGVLSLTVVTPLDDWKKPAILLGTEVGAKLVTLGYIKVVNWMNEF